MSHIFAHVIVPPRPSTLPDQRPTYVPMLGVKRAEHDALRELPPDVNRRIYPLLSVRPIRKTYTKTDESTGLRKAYPPPSIDEHIAKQVSLLEGIVQIQVGLFDNGIIRAMLDVSALDRQKDVSTLAEFQRGLGHRAASFVPVTYVDATSAHVTAVRRWTKQFAGGVALRVRPYNGSTGYPSLEELRDASLQCGIAIDQVDLVIDLGGVSAHTVTTRAREASSKLPEYCAAKWRSVTVGAGAFPESIAKCDFDIFHRFVRWDLVLWKRIVFELGKRAMRTPTFGDYGMLYYKFADGGTLPEPNLRYTDEHEWRVIRREFEPGMAVLCKRMSAERYFRGPDYSRGELWIEQCGRGIAKEEDAKRWLRAGLMQHISFVARQMDSGRARAQ